MERTYLTATGGLRTTKGSAGEMALKLDSTEAYKTFALKSIENTLKGYYGNLSNIYVEDIKQNVADINKYPRMLYLVNPRDGDIMVIESHRTYAAERAVLSGRVFFEHTAAGEATRLGLGAKYLLKLNEFPIDKISDLMVKEFVEEQVACGVAQEAAQSDGLSKYSPEKVQEMIGFEPTEISPLSLGVRHMAQIVYDLTKLARKHNIEAKKVLDAQKMLVVVNEATSEQIINELTDHNNFGIKDVCFMVQQSFPGIDMQMGTLSFDESNPQSKRLHNHGQMMLQKCHENTIFRISRKEKEYLSFSEFNKMLSNTNDMISYNIEDLNYLTESIDYRGINFALDIGMQGYQMMMEVVRQNPLKPQKGGVCFYDKSLGRTVMVETNRLAGIKYEDIEYLNKNINHYIDPSKAMITLRTQGIDMPFNVKEDTLGKPYIYPCPVQGDLNLKVKCAFVMKPELRPISSLKSAMTIPAAIKAMKAQDEQDGFLDFVDAIC